MPHAIEWSLATPITRPRFPPISPDILYPRRFRSLRSFPRKRESRATRHFYILKAGPPLARGRAGEVLRIQPLEHHRCVRAAEAERVRQHRADLHVVAALAHDRHALESRVEVLDVG